MTYKVFLMETDERQQHIEVSITAQDVDLRMCECENSTCNHDTDFYEFTGHDNKTIAAFPAKNIWYIRA